MSCPGESVAQPEDPLAEPEFAPIIITGANAANLRAAFARVTAALDKIYAAALAARGPMREFRERAKPFNFAR